MRHVCKATIATGEIVHIDASLIRANVSWESLVERHVVEVLEENKIEEEVEVEKRDRQSSKCKKVCVTDPDATMATNARNRHLEPCYKQHTAVDDKVGVILDVEVTTGEKNEGEMIAPQVDEVRATTGIDIKTRYCRCRLCLREGLRCSRAARHRCVDPGKGRADQIARADAPLSLRRQARHLEVPERARSAPDSAREARSLFLFQGQGLRALSVKGRLSVERASEQSRRGRRRLSRSAQSPTPP